MVSSVPLTLPEDVHMHLERDIADFLGTEAAIIYSQGFATISSVIPAFCKRGDIIVADRAANFAIQKGIQISRSTVRWFDHNDLNSLEEVLESVEKERKKRRAPLTRRFVVTESVFEKDGAMVDLPKLVCCISPFLISDTNYGALRWRSSSSINSVSSWTNLFPLVWSAAPGVG
jgi:7-keto-8-aminopelargonate synthetase-like enzyme